MGDAWSDPCGGPRVIAAQEPLPLYHRIYLLLRQSVQDGAWPTDRPMPGEHELATTHGVSRITVRRALERLEAEGLVARRRGAGTYARPPAPARHRDNLRGLMENLLVMGLQTSVQLLDFAYVPAPGHAAALLDVVPGTVAQRSIRVRARDGIAFSHLTAWVPESLGRAYAAEDLRVRPLLRLLEQAGATPARADQTISARLAESEVAARLAIEAGAPLLWVRRRVWDRDGRVIEALEALYRPDMYEYQVGLTRQGELWSPEGT